MVPDTYPKDLTGRRRFENSAYDLWYNEKGLLKPFYYHNLRNEKAFIRSLMKKFHMKRGGTLLDIGCGNGAYSFLFQQGGMKVTGVDLSKNAIEYCNANHHGEIEFVCADVFDLKDIDTKFDYIFCNFFTFFNAFDVPEAGKPYADKIMSYLKKPGMLLFVWITDLTAVRLPVERFAIMNFTVRQLHRLYDSYPVNAYAIDGKARTPLYLGKLSFNKYLTRLSCALTQLLASSWSRVRVVLVVQK